MKIAVTYDNGEIFQHFGHTSLFKLYEVCDGKIEDSRILETNGSGHGALADILKQAEVDSLICGGIGGGARTALSDVGIQLYPGVSGNADDAVLQLLKGTLNYNPDTMCNHHGEGDECGENKHGCHGN